MKEIDRSYELLKVFKSVKEAIRQNFESQFKDLNITGPQGMLLGTLIHNGAMKISDLSERMCLSNSTVSSIIDRMEKQGHVQRIRSEEDRRVVHVDVTPAFKEVAQERFKAMEEHIVQVFQLATPEEMEQVLTGLKLLDTLLKRAKEKE